MSDSRGDPIAALRALETQARLIRERLHGRLTGGETSRETSPAALAAAMIAGRRLLARYLPSDCFGDPALQILLDLFVAAEAGENRAIKACTLTSGVPPTTALRYLDLLFTEGLIERSGDPEDGRRVLVMLTAYGRDSLRAWLNAVAAIPLELARSA